MNSIGDRLKKARLLKELTQVEVSKRTGINNKTLSGYENDVSTPDPDTFNVLSRLYGVTLDYLMGNSDIMTEPKNNINKDVLSLKDEKEIEKRVAKLREDLTKQEGFMLSGDPASPEAIESILEALEFGIRQAKIINKKYTPRKYRKDE